VGDILRGMTELLKGALDGIVLQEIKNTDMRSQIIL